MIQRPKCNAFQSTIRAFAAKGKYRSEDGAILSEETDRSRLPWTRRINNGRRSKIYRSLREQSSRPPVSKPSPRLSVLARMAGTRPAM